MRKLAVIKFQYKDLSAKQKAVLALLNSMTPEEQWDTITTVKKRYHAGHLAGAPDKYAEAAKARKARLKAGS